MGLGTTPQLFGFFREFLCLRNPLRYRRAVRFARRGVAEGEGDGEVICEARCDLFAELDNFMIGRGNNGRQERGVVAAPGDVKSVEPCRVKGANVP